MMAYWQWNDGQQSKDDFSALAELVAENRQRRNRRPRLRMSGSRTDERELAYEKYKALYEQNNDFVGGSP
jgi:hypothetical protein